MSKRASTDSKQAKSNKKMKSNNDDFINSEVDMDSNENSTMTTDISFELNMEEIKEFMTKISPMWKYDSNAKKIAAITKLFKDLIDSEQNRNASLFYAVIHHLIHNSITMEDNLVSQISSLLALQIDSMPIEFLSLIMDIFVNQIKDEKPFNVNMISLFIEVFKFCQKAFSSDLDKKKTDVNDKGNLMIEGKLESLFHFKLNEKTAMNVLEIFINITTSQHLIKKLLALILDVKKINWTNSQIPGLINSILSLNAVKSNRSLVFESILHFFVELKKIEANTSRHDFTDAEIISIRHIIQFIRTDSDSFKDLLKILKSKLGANLSDLIQPFTFGLILSLIKSSSQPESIFEVLKQILIKIYETEMKCNNYQWICKCVKPEIRELSKQLIKPSKYRLFGLEPVLTGLIEFLFELIDSYGVRMNKAIQPVNLKEHLSKYGSEMIRDIFRYVHGSREVILNKITDRILSSKLDKSMIYIDQLSMLINSEPANAFQEYFGKFKGRLDHMIYMIPDVAMEFLNCIKPLLKFESVYKDDLILKLKKSIYQNNVEIRKVGVSGLIYLLTTTKLKNFLPSSQASQSMSLSQSQSQISRVNLSQEKTSEKNCLEIFQGLRRCLTQQPEIRLKLYQSCYNLVSQNSTLIGPTLNLLLINLENYLIQTNDILIIDYSKCCRLNDENKLEMQEPVDVLLHSLLLCNETFMKMELDAKFQDLLDEDIKKHSDVIKKYMDSLKQNILRTDEKQLFDTYKTQVMLMMIANTKKDLLTTAKATQLRPIQPQTQQQQQQHNIGQTQKTQLPKQTQASAASREKNEIDPKTLMPFYQGFLGSIEVLIEYCFKNSSFKLVKDLQNKFSKLHDVIQKNFSGVEKSNTEAQKKKPGAKKASATQKENKTKRSTQRTQAMDEDAGENVEGEVEEGNAKQVATKPIRKSQPPKFTYTHRLSYTCTLGLLQIYFNKEAKLGKSIAKEEFDDSMVHHIKQDKYFFNYIIKVLLYQLDVLLNQATLSKTTATSNLMVYDCESYNDKQLFEYLFEIWTLFWQEASTPKCENGTCGIQNFCDECVEQKFIYVTILNNIWKIVSIKFNLKLKDLFTYSTFGDADMSRNSLDMSNTSIVAVGILDQCRTFIKKSIMVDNINSRVKSMKLATQLLEFMYDISLSFSTTLNKDDLQILFSWCQSLASTKTNNDPAFVKSLFKFFIFVTWHKNSSVALVKYVCQDLANMIEVLNKNNDTSVLNTQTPIDSCFTCITENNLHFVIAGVCEELLSIFDLFDWLISYNATGNSYNKQILFAFESIKHLINLEIKTNCMTAWLIKILVKFYNFMINFCKHMASKQLENDDNDLQFLKMIIDETGLNIHKPINDFINIIQNSYKSHAKMDNKADKEQAAKNSKLSKFTRSVPNLVYVVQQFEQQLPILNKNFKKAEIDFTEKFNNFFRDFQINLKEIEDMDPEKTVTKVENSDDEDNDNENMNDDNDTNLSG